LVDEAEPVLIEVYALLLGADSRYNLERKDRLVLHLEGALNIYSHMRTLQTLFVKKRSLDV